MRRFWLGPIFAIFCQSVCLWSSNHFQLFGVAVIPVTMGVSLVTSTKSGQSLANHHWRWLCKAQLQAHAVTGGWAEICGTGNVVPPSDHLLQHCLWCSTSFSIKKALTSGLPLLLDWTLYGISEAWLLDLLWISSKNFLIRIVETIIISYTWFRIWMS